MYNKYQNSIYSLYKQTWNIEIGYTDIFEMKNLSDWGYFHKLCVIKIASDIYL